MKKQTESKKTFEGIVTSVKMQKTAVVRVSRETPHPLYKKLMKKDSDFSVDIGSFTPVVGDKVKIIEIKPISKTKHFKILEVIKNGSA